MRVVTDEGDTKYVLLKQKYGQNKCLILFYTFYKIIEYNNIKG